MSPNTDDNFDAMNEHMQEMFDAARRKQQEDKAWIAMENARTVMVMSQKADHVFFATLVCKLVYRHDWSLPTAATDGYAMYYNPDFMLSLSKEHVRFVHAHEVMHCVLLHPQMIKRLPHYDKVKLNVAMDLVINWILQEAGYQVPDMALLPGKGQFKDIPPNLSTLETYHLLKDKHMKGLKGSDPGGFGGVIAPKGEAATEAGLSQSEQQWKQNAAQASNAAKQRGSISAGLDQAIGNLLQSKVNWREVVRDFFTKNTKTEYSWTPPNKRYLWAGLYLPKLGGHTLAGLIIANDTSGSMYLGPRSACAGEIQGICEQLCCDVTVLHHDSEVCSVQKWNPAEGSPLKLEPKGGGGTSHVPVFDWIKDNDHEGEISALICMTDLYTNFPKEVPEYPVLWCVIGNNKTKPPFGTVIYIDDEDGQR